MEIKKCNKCCENKEIIHFHKKTKTSDGYNTICIQCVKVKQKEYWERTKEEKKEKFKEYYQENKQMFIDYHSENKEKILENQKKYREGNKEKVKKIKQDYVKNNTTKIYEYRKKYYLENKEKILAKNREWNKKNAHIVAWRSVLKSQLRRMGNTKEGKTIDILGYSALDLKQHIESLFIEGMTWDNHGEWHIDHKIPVTKFDKETPPNVVNALSNLQPLWANENRSKYNKI
jgi:hypothetical protein